MPLTEDLLTAVCHCISSIIILEVAIPDLRRTLGRLLAEKKFWCSEYSKHNVKPESREHHQNYQIA